VETTIVEKTLTQLNMQKQRHKLKITETSKLVDNSRRYELNNADETMLLPIMLLVWVLIIISTSHNLLHNKNTLQWHLKN
jgi:type VI protein secretion system component VasF